MGIRGVDPSNIALRCFEHYRTVVGLVDAYREGSEDIRLATADALLETVREQSESDYSTVMRMLEAHYGISWAAIRDS